MGKPLSAWELKENARRTAERRRRTIRRAGTCAAIVVIFSAAGLFGLKASRANLPIVPAKSVAVSDNSPVNGKASAFASTPVSHDSNILSLTGTTAVPDIGSNDISLAGTGVSLTPVAPR